MHLNNRPPVIILNGAPASGKSTLQSLLLQRLGLPYLKVGIDTFFFWIQGITPTSHLGSEEDFKRLIYTQERIDEDHHISCKLKMGPVAYRIIQGMHRAIAAYAIVGNPVIVDYTMYDSSWKEDFEIALKGINALKIGCFAPVEVLEEREKQRNASIPGLARYYARRTHEGWNYDLKLDTHRLSSEECIEEIIKVARSVGHNLVIR